MSIIRTAEIPKIGKIEAKISASVCKKLGIRFYQKM